MPRIKTVDSKCFDLACHFLDELRHVPDGDRMALAIEIQQVVEDWIEAYGDHPHPDSQFGVGA